MIDLSRTDTWVQICEVEGNDLKFTQEYLKITGCLGWGARKLASHLALGWDKEYENLLDYFGPEDAEEDLYSGIDGQAMDVCEITPEKLENKDIPLKGLDKEWHRDLYRAKLMTLKIPKKLLEQYVQVVNQQRERR